MALICLERMASRYTQKGQSVPYLFLHPKALQEASKRASINRDLFEMGLGNVAPTIKSDAPSQHVGPLPHHHEL